jgi:hypothetical protein
VVTPHAVKPTVVAPQPVAPEVVKPAEAAPAPAPVESSPEVEPEASSAVTEPTRAGAPVGIASCDGRGCPEQIPTPPRSEPTFPPSWEPLERVQEIFIGRLVCPWYFSSMQNSLDVFGEELQAHESDPTEISQGAFDALEQMNSAIRHYCLHVREP